MKETLHRLFGYWRPPSAHDLRLALNADGFVIVPFGDNPDNVVNLDLRQAAREYQKSTAREAARQQKQFSTKADGRMSNTHDFFVHVANRHPKSTIVIFCHSAHAWRCKWIALKLGFLPIIISRSMVTNYDHRENQLHAAYSWSYTLWERLARLHHVVAGWI